MLWKTSDTALKTDKPFYYIAGSVYYIDTQIKKILEPLEDCETESFSPEDISGGSFFGYISSAPLFSESKAAVVRSFDSVKSPESIISSCAGCREAVIIFTAEDIKLSKGLITALNDAGFNTLIEPKTQKYDLTGKIIRMFSDAGFNLDTSSAGEINEVFGGDMSRISSELDKLTAYFAYKKPKNQNDILNAITAKKNENIFDFIDAFTKKRKSECVIILDDLIRTDENLAILIVLLFKRMREVYVFGLSRDMIKENRPFMLEKIKAGASAWKKDELNRLFGQFAELDYMLKTGQIKEDGYLTNLIGGI